MHCASCASVIEKTFKKVDGVSDVAVNNATETAVVGFDENKTNFSIFDKKTLFPLPCVPTHEKQKFQTT